jgi:replicative DNA helicase
MTDTRSSEVDWPAPRPLGEAPLPSFPVQVLPTWLATWVERQALALQVPTDLPAMLALSAISTALARSYEVEVRAGWIEPVNIYTLVALPSGTRKSVVFDAATAPLLALELGSEAAIAPALADASEAHLRLVVDGAGAVDHASRTQRGASPPPTRPSLFVSDATPERVASLLSENAGRMSVLSDEGEICAIIAGRYGGSFEVFLKAHSGQVIAIERQGRDRVHVRRPALTLGLAVQPDVLETLARKKALRDRGLLARFLVAVPSSNVGFRQIAAPPVPLDVVATYAANLTTLVVNHSDSERETQALSLTPEAHGAFVAFETKVEAMLRPDGQLGSLASWGSKLAGAVARLAGLLQCARSTETESETIDAEAVAAAIQIGEYLVPHALRAFSMAGGNSAHTDARAILTWLAEDRLSTTTPTGSTPDASYSLPGRVSRGCTTQAARPPRLPAAHPD